MTGISLTIAAAYYSLTLRNTQKNQQMQLETRQTQLYMQVFNMSYNNRTFMDAYFRLIKVEWKGYEDFTESIGFNQTEYTDLGNELIHVSSFYEGVGVMVKEKMLDIHIIAVMMSAMTRILWEKLESFVYKHRETADIPRWLSEYEYLYNELMKYHKEHPELKT